jgi:pimeloyl-ACP methyl ester carboxylesterase
MRGVLVRAISDVYLPLLSGITMRVELVWGENDSAASTQGARAAIEVLADANLCVLPGVGHMVPLEAPAELRAALGRWSR